MRSSGACRPCGGCSSVRSGQFDLIVRDDDDIAVGCFASRSRRASGLDLVLAEAATIPFVTVPISASARRPTVATSNLNGTPYDSFLNLRWEAADQVVVELGLN